jgi:hypothetical protein
MRKALGAEQTQREHAEATSALALEALARTYDRFAPTRLVVTPPTTTEEGADLPIQPVLPPEAQGVPLIDAGSSVPNGSQQGIRFNHAGERLEFALSFFNGFNHLPDIESRVLPAAIEFRRIYPTLRAYGADMAVPLRAVALKGEAAFFASPTGTSEEYVLYVVELERQVREWVLVGGYAGEVVTKTGENLPFAPDRGMRPQRTLLPCD